MKYDLFSVVPLTIPCLAHELQVVWGAQVIVDCRFLYSCILEWGGAQPPHGMRISCVRAGAAWAVCPLYVCPGGPEKGLSEVLSTLHVRST